jgi:nitrate reductase gamma subunit
VDLLTFARGPALTASLAIFVGGVLWRLVALFLLPQPKDVSPKRPGSASPAKAAFEAMIGRMTVAPPFRQRTRVGFVNAWIFHVGYLMILLLGAPHILFLSGLLPLPVWPGLPKGIIDLISFLTLASLLFALFQRRSHPVRRLLSTADDYLSWLLTTLPVITGILATTVILGRYETLLALHILSVEALLIYFPFGKLMHAFLWFFSRGLTGVRFAHRGART